MRTEVWASVLSEIVLKKRKDRLYIPSSQKYKNAVADVQMYTMLDIVNRV